MTIDETTVYLFRTNITETSAPFGRYRAFARNALSHVDFDLPETGTILLKANATILFPAEKRVVTHPGFLTGIGDILIERGISPDRIVIGDGQLGERPDIGQTWEGAGYRFAVEQLGARLAPLNETEKRPVGYQELKRSGPRSDHKCFWLSPGCLPAGRGRGDRSCGFPG